MRSGTLSQLPKSRWSAIREKSKALSRAAQSITLIFTVFSVAASTSAWAQLHPVNDARFSLPTLSFPLQAKKLRVGRTNKVIQIEKNLAINPVAVVGADNLSVSWLTTNVEYLVSKQAVVLVVSAASAFDFDALVSRFPRLKMLPVRGDESLAKELSLEIYPILVDPLNGVIQQ